MKLFRNMLVCVFVFLEAATIIASIEIVRESRSIENSAGDSKLLSSRTSIQRLVGGHVKNIPEVLDEESTGNGKKSKPKKDNDDEDKKTLSQQVAEGKYGLIQKELFSSPPKRPGVISYSDNPDVPKDTKNNLGGLEDEDIWLAEDHLLVLKGGSFPEHNSKGDVGANWPPIDNYRAPRRQVKIPSNPKIPPPFPVQLQDTEPLHFIGPNGTTFPVPDRPEPGYPNDGYVPGDGPFFPKSDIGNFTYTGDTPFPIPPYAYGPPPGNFSTGNGPPPPFPYGFGDVDPSRLPPFPAFPPGQENKTDFYDEDDPSIYYPPPYSFYYPKDNSSSVPPGPLVPGIVLPPPPDFFAPLDEKNYTAPTPTDESHTTTTPSPIPSTKYTPPNTVYITPPKPIYKPPPTIHTITKPIYVPDVPNNIQINIPSTDNYNDNLQSITTPSTIVSIPTATRVKPTTPYIPKISNYYTSQRPDVSLTYLKPITKQPSVVSTTPAYYDYQYENNAVSQTPYSVYGPSERQKILYGTQGKTSYVSTTAVPLKAYYTTGRDIESNSVTSEPVTYYRPTESPPAKSSQKLKPASYYFYEEDSVENSLGSTTQTPYSRPQKYYPQNQQNYYTRNRVREYVQTQRPYNQYRTNPQVESITNKIARLRQEIQSILTPNKAQVQYQTSPKPVYQYSFQAAGYVPKNTNPQIDTNDKFRPMVQYSVPYNQFQQSTTEGYYRQDVPTKSTRYNYVRPTPNPINNGYYTKQDERLLDDITKQYFNVFGQKINDKEIPVTPSLQQIEVTTVKPPQYSNKENYYGHELQDITENPIHINYGDNSQAVPEKQTLGDTLVNFKSSRPAYTPNSSPIVPDKHIKPISLLSDTLVNYKDPRPRYNPDSEFIPIVNPAYTHGQLTNYPVKSLESDTLINYRFPRPNINPDAEYVDPQHRRQNFSLLTDINVNYKRPLPPLNRDAEILRPVYYPNKDVEEIDASYDPRRPNSESIETFYHQNYKGSGENTHKPNSEYIEVVYPQDYISSSGEEINSHRQSNSQPVRNGYVQQYPGSNDVQIVKSVNVLTKQGPVELIDSNYRHYAAIDRGRTRPQAGHKDSSGQFISYQLPGDGAHFYFLTPQAAAQQQKGDGSGYVYDDLQRQRLRRSRLRQRAQRRHARN